MNLEKINLTISKKKSLFFWIQGKPEGVKKIYSLIGNLQTYLYLGANSKQKKSLQSFIGIFCIYSQLSLSLDIEETIKLKRYRDTGHVFFNFCTLQHLTKYIQKSYFNVKNNKNLTHSPA